MQVVNEVFPSDPAQIQALLSEGPPGPIFMVNLLKFKDRAEYEDGRACDLSGRDAYMIYGRAVAALLPKFGGRALFAAELPPDQVEANMAYIRALLTQQNRWDLIKGEG